VATDDAGGGDAETTTDATSADADADANTDASADADAGYDAGPPAVQFIGRFDDGDALGKRFAWPGSRIVATFDGTDAQVKLTQTDGFGGGPTWFDVVLDGVRGTPFSVAAGTINQTVATGLVAGTHTVEIEKRTEANLGTVRFEGFTFTGGTGLLPPPPRKTRRIEILSDSTIDGFGVEGDIATTCGGGAPAQFNDVHKSTAAIAAAALDAEPFILAYSGKGITVNEYVPDTDTFDILYPRTLPETATTWTFTSWTPDVVVISLGGTDFDGLTTIPTGFVTKYGQLVDTVRGHYATAHIYMTVWAQIKDATRTAMTSALQQVASARAADTLLHVYSFAQCDQTVETGCYAHANAIEHQAMGAALATQIKADLGW
jgi:hypothetical protein